VLAVLSRFLTDQVASNGYLAIFLLMLLGSACIPIPSEVVMAFGGALASATFAERVLGDPTAQLSLVPVIVAGVAGSVAGSAIAYWAGAAGGRPLIDRWGRYLLLRPHEVDRAHVWFERHGQAAVFWVRLVPLARAFISLPAGVARMRFDRFLLYTFLGVLPWTVGLAVAGHELGDRWRTAEHVLWPVSIAVGVLGLAAIAWWYAKRRRAVVESTSERPDAG